MPVDAHKEDKLVEIPLLEILLVKFEKGCIVSVLCCNKQLC